MPATDWEEPTSFEPDAGELHRLRLLFAFDNRVPSAQADTEQLVNNLAAISRAGVPATLLVPRLSGEASAEEIRRFYRVEGSFEVAHYRSPSRPRIAQKLWAALRTGLFGRTRSREVLYTRNLPIALGAAARGHRLIHETYRPWPDQYPVLRPAIRRLTRAPGFVGAILHSQVARRSYERIGIPGDRLLVAHNGYDPRRMEPALERGEARELLGLAPDRPVAVYTGRVDREKGLDVVLEMARRLPRVRFLLVGAKEGSPVRDGGFRRDARSVPNVDLVPWQPYHRVSRFLYAADVLLLPPSLRPLSEHGNTVLPMKLFSYLPAGRAILGPDREDLREILQNGENARLVPPGGVAAAADALRELLEDPELRARLAEGARKTARGLTWDARARRILDFVDGRLAEMSES